MAQGGWWDCVPGGYGPQERNAPTPAVDQQADIASLLRDLLAEVRAL
jgi:hypothetical protein